MFFNKTNFSISSRLFLDNTRCKIMLHNINSFFKDLKEDVCLQHISILLNTINKTLKLLEQEVFVYCQDVKNDTFLFYQK